MIDTDLTTTIDHNSDISFIYFYFFFFKKPFQLSLILICIFIHLFLILVASNSKEQFVLEPMIKNKLLVRLEHTSPFAWEKSSYSC